VFITYVVKVGFVPEPAEVYGVPALVARESHMQRLQWTEGELANRPVCDEKDNNEVSKVARSSSPDGHRP
jgi:hypothetical protein